MKLILTQDVSNLGVIGDTIDVKPGYGRNYLLPQGMALLASGKKSKELKHRLQYLKKLRADAVAQAQEIAEKLKLNINLRPQNLSPKNYFDITTEYENLNN